MKYNFDEVINRKGTYAIKWELEAVAKLYGMEVNVTPNTIPMMVADMDFACPPKLVEAMHRVADHRIYGYTATATEPAYTQCIVDWYKKRYNTELKNEWIHYSDGSVTAINCAMDTFTNPGDGIIITPPVYGHFNGMIDGETTHKIVHSNLINTDGYYTMDWEDFEAKCAVPTNRAFILCSPSNPIGRVWTEDELKKMIEITRKHNVLLIADEIHSDIVFKGYKHHPIVSLTDDYSNIIMVIGINKSFNVAGLRCSNVVIPDDNLRAIFLDKFGHKSPTPFALAAQVSAYTECEDWLDELVEYLESNIDYAIDFFAKKMPKLKVLKPEGTYMLWLDFSEYGLTEEEITDRIYNKADVVLQAGSGHDPAHGAMYQRMCVTLARPVLEEALERIAAQF